MYFERFENCLNSIEENEVKLDIVLNLVNCVLDDALEKNNTSNIYEIPYDDASDVAQSLLPFINVMISLIDHLDKEQLMDLQAGIISESRRYLETVVPEFEALEVQRKDVIDSKKKAKEKKSELEKQHRELDAERGHLLHAQEECKQLQAEIDRLNDPYLDGLAEQKTELEATVQVKRKKEGELVAKLQELQENLTNIELDLSKSEKRIEELTEEISVKETTKAEGQEKIKKLEENKKALEKWQHDFEATEHKLHEETEQINLIIKAGNSAIKNDKFIQEIDKQKMIDYNMFSAGDKEKITFDGKELECVKDLEKYLDSLMSRIDALLAIYQKVFKEFHQQADKVLNNSEIDNK